MIKNKKSRPVTIVLSIVTLLIWSAILFRVYEFYFSSGDVEVMDNKIEKILLENIKEEKENIKCLVDTIERDPFRRKVKTSIQKPKQKTPQSKKLKIEPPKNIINFRIVGFINNGDKKIIMLEDITNKKTVYLELLQEYENIKILKIEKDKIIVKIYDEEKEININ